MNPLEEKSLDIERFRWQKQKFMVLTVLMTMALTMITSLFYIQFKNSRTDLDSRFYIQEFKEIIYKNEAKMSLLDEQIRELQLRNRNLEDYSKSLKESTITNQELLLTLRKDIEKLKEAKNVRMVE